MLPFWAKSHGFLRVVLVENDNVGSNDTDYAQTYRLHASEVNCWLVATVCKTVLSGIGGSIPPWRT